MQNKANVKIGKMNITSAITMNYINELWTTNYELIMKTNPNKPNFKKNEYKLLYYRVLWEQTHIRSE